MPGFFDWVSSGISTAVQPFTNWLTDNRSSDLTRPRLDSSDPTHAIDSVTPTSILSFPHDRPKYYITFGFEEYERPNQFQGLQSKGVTDYLCLPLPNNMKDANAITYNVQPGHILGEAASMAGDAVSDIVKTGSVGDIKKSVGDLVSATGDAASGWGVNKIVQGLKAAESLVGERGLTDSALQIAGLADNPFMTVMMKGPQFKAHHFVWRFAPKSPEESRTVQRIRDMIKKVAYPELLTLGAGGFFKYPYIVWPKFQPDVLQETTYRFKPCVITDFSFNHTPNDRPGLYAGTSASVEVVFEMQLLEIELWRGGNGDRLTDGKLPTIDGDFVTNLGNI
jgi:hypothetical protein